MSERDEVGEAVHVLRYEYCAFYAGAPGHLPETCDDCLFARRAVEAGIKIGRDIALAMSEPWSLTEVVERLANAADHLLGHHSCDAHGHEGVRAAEDAARAWLTRIGKVTP